MSKLTRVRKTFQLSMSIKRLTVVYLHKENDEIIYVGRGSPGRQLEQRRHDSEHRLWVYNKLLQDPSANSWCEIVLISSDDSLVKQKEYELIKEHRPVYNTVGLQSPNAHILRGRKRPEHAIAVTGKKNGRYKNGKWTKAALAEKRRLLAEQGRGNMQKKVSCPHCGLTGSGPNMTRYHYDNCKHRIKNEEY